MTRKTNIYGNTETGTTKPDTFHSVPQKHREPAKKIGKLRASYLLTVESFELLRKDKEILWFPILAFVLCTLTLVLIVVAIWFIPVPVEEGWVDDEYESFTRFDAYFYGLLFLFYVITAFIVAFSQAAITHIVYTRINGGDATFSDGWHTAQSISGKLFIWSLISSTVGLVLRWICERSKLLVRIITAVIGAAWSLLTFFIVPTLVLEDKSVTQSIKESGSTFRKTWGETLVSGFGIGIFFFGLTFLGLLLGGLSFFGIMSLEVDPDMQGALAAAVIVMTALYLVGISLVNTSLNAVLKVVLYVYAKHGTVPDSFEPELILGMLQKKEK